MTTRKQLIRSSLAVGLLAASALSASAAPLIFNSTSSANNASTRAAWLSTVGITSGATLIDFESGFTNGQDIAGQSLAGGLVVRDLVGDLTPGAFVRSGTGVVGGSNPIDSFALTHDNDTLRLDFSAAPINYLGFFDIDQTGFGGFDQVIGSRRYTFVENSIITFMDGSTYQFGALDSNCTGTHLNSAEFYGLYFGKKTVKWVDLDTGGGDNIWVLDNLEFGRTALPDAGSTFALFGLGLLGIGAVRRFRKA